MKKLPGLLQAGEHWFIVLSDGEEGVHAGVLGHVEELILDAQQLIVLGDAVGAGGGAGLYLAGVKCNSQICYGGILSLTGAVGGNCGHTGLVRHLDGLKGLRYGSDLVELDQDGVGSSVGDTFGQSLGIGNKVSAK